MDWSTFLGTLTNNAEVVAAGVAVLIALALEYSRAYGTLSTAQKQLVFMGLAFVLPLLAVVLGILSLDWSYTWPGHWWSALQAGFVASGIGTLAHRIDVQVRQQ